MRISDRITVIVAAVEILGIVAVGCVAAVIAPKLLREFQQTEARQILEAYKLGQLQTSAIYPPNKALLDSLLKTCQENLRRHDRGLLPDKWDVAFNKGCVGESLTAEDKEPDPLLTIFKNDFFKMTDRFLELTRR